MGADQPCGGRKDCSRQGRAAPTIASRALLSRTQPLRYPSYLSTTASDGSNDTAVEILSRIATPSSILFDPRYTSRQRPSALPPFRTFPPSPTVEKRLPLHVPSTISIQNLDLEDHTSDMDKRHPSSFQQLEKLGEGTYATVSAMEQSYLGSLLNSEHCYASSCPEAVRSHFSTPQHPALLFFLLSPFYFRWPTSGYSFCTPLMPSGIQRSKSTNRRIGSIEGDTSRLRRRHTVHCNP
jgi:hypothetical protein